MRLLDAYESYHRASRRIRSKHTDMLYRLALRQFAASLGHDPGIADLTDDSIVGLEKYLTGRTVETVNHTTGRIKALWRWCCKRGMATQWPTIERLPAPEPYRRCWTVDQVRQILVACERMPGELSGVQESRWWRVWHLVQWETGERTGALLQLRWDWVTPTGLDFPADARKGGKAAYYRLSARCLAELETIRRPIRPLVFPWPLHHTTFYLHYSRLLVMAGLPSDRRCKPQRMRRSHLTYWQAGGEDATARAHHVDAETTRRHYLDETILCGVDPSTVLPTL